MEPKVNFTLVGLFVVLLTTALVGAALWLSKSDYRAVYDRYYAYMTESVSGLSVNSPVKYRGVDVGRVKEIILNPDDPEEVRLTLDIARGTPIKEDTLAVLYTQGLTGLAIVNLAGGSRESPPLTAKGDQAYPVIKTGPSLLFRIDEALSRLLADQALSRLLANSNGLIEDSRAVIGEENRAALKQILADAATLTRTLAAQHSRLDHGVASAAQTLDHFVNISKTMDEQLPAVVERIKRSTVALEAMSKELARTSTEVGALVHQTKPNVEQFTGQTLSEVSILVAELRQLTGTLQRLASHLEQEPNALIFGRVPQSRGPGE